MDELTRILAEIYDRIHHISKGKALRRVLKWLLQVDGPFTLSDIQHTATQCPYPAYFAGATFDDTRNVRFGEGFWA